MSTVIVNDMDPQLVRLGFLCKCYRRKAGFTQAETAKAMGKSMWAVSSFERGRTCPITFLLYYLKTFVPVPNWETLLEDVIYGNN